MDALDWAIIVMYIVGVIAMSVWLSRKQQNSDDYYVGSRDMHWLAVGVSTMATQTSAISFIGIPAYVALKSGGGANWLQYEVAVPLAVMVLTALLVPYWRALRLVSVFEFLSMRYDVKTRRTLSAVFLVSRSLGTAVGVYASAIVLAVVLNWSVSSTVVFVGVITVIYDCFGGIKAVVYSDVVQMTILMAGLILAILAAADEAGGFSAAAATLTSARRTALEADSGNGLWAFLFGGFVLYCSYYGTDQSQVQRQLGARDVAAAKRALALNAVARFPLTVSYVLLGVAASGAYHHSTALRDAVDGSEPDRLVPEIVRLLLPAGVRALVFGAMLAAAMSSLDSALNALSAATVTDFVLPWLRCRHGGGPADEDATELASLREIGGHTQSSALQHDDGSDSDEVPLNTELSEHHLESGLAASESRRVPSSAPGEDEHHMAKLGDRAEAPTHHPSEGKVIGASTRQILLLSKLATFAWGAVITSLALLTPYVSSSVIEGVNKVGSAFYGPMLMPFLLGVTCPRSVQNEHGVRHGVWAGVGFNLLLWIAAGDSVHWMWWNVFGLVASSSVSLALSRLRRGSAAPPTSAMAVEPPTIKSAFAESPRFYIALILYTIVIFIVLGTFPAMLRAAAA